MVVDFCFEGGEREGRDSGVCGGVVCVLICACFGYWPCAWSARNSLLSALIFFEAELGASTATITLNGTAQHVLLS